MWAGPCGAKGALGYMIHLMTPFTITLFFDFSLHTKNKVAKQRHELTNAIPSHLTVFIMIFQ
jgi:hypothetical protein